LCEFLAADVHRERAAAQVRRARGEAVGRAADAVGPAEAPLELRVAGDVDGDRARAAIDGAVAYAAPWEPIPDDGLERYEERMPR
jgi:hypothetical protein